ncbi:polymeric immunoglobulin receptor-like [Misgurnus anguillicaudatus]|uniref:polymeric immunoglobulin receptor-like n=1 Tax=Misgurnus anguillicaudatus TaxID=75329 RepID=UPI003CCFB391
MMKIWRNKSSQLFDMQTVSLKFIVVILWTITGGECRTVTVQTGGSVIIPCHYESKYTQHKKYWCYDLLGFFQFCSILAYSNETKGDVSVIDHPDQSLFTVTMRDLQEQNTGDYSCAMEIEGAAYDVTEKFYITIQPAPDVSVMPSSVTVDEGGNISIQCLYTSTYKNKHKQWCRYKDKRCYTVRRSDTSQNSVEISDDGRGSLTVVMSGLMKSDSGWYYCSVGDLHASVQLTVNVAKVSLGHLQTPVELNDAEPTTARVEEDDTPLPPSAESYQLSSSDSSTHKAASQARWWRRLPPVAACSLAAVPVRSPGQTDTG